LFYKYVEAISLPRFVVEFGYNYAIFVAD